MSKRLGSKWTAFSISKPRSCTENFESDCKMQCRAFTFCKRREFICLLCASGRCCLARPTRTSSPWDFGTANGNPPWHLGLPPSPRGPSYRGPLRPQGRTRSCSRIPKSVAENVGRNIKFIKSEENVWPVSALLHMNWQEAYRSHKRATLIHALDILYGNIFTLRKLKYVLFPIDDLHCPVWLPLTNVPCKTCDLQEQTILSLILSDGWTDLGFVYAKL